MAETIVVTGAAGFIGSRLSRTLLARDCRVIGIDNFDPFYDRSAKQANLEAIGGSGFSFIEADIRNAKAMEDLFASERPRGVFHIAALAGVRPSILDPVRYGSVNVDGLVSMLQACRAGECRRFVFASSSSVYGNNEKVPFAETDDVGEPISPYAATKRAGELICHAYAHLFGIAVASLRFFTVYGPAQRPDLAIAKFMRLIAAGEEIPMFGDGTSSRDYTFIDDIIGGVSASYDKLASEGDGFCRIYNLGGSQPVALRDMIAAIGEVVGREPRIRTMPMQPGDVNRTWADLTRSKAELGYEPKTDFAAGLERQWAWITDRESVRA
jgi:UDP-glucuronate 4-epimerase